LRKDSINASLESIVKLFKPHFVFSFLLVVICIIRVAIHNIYLLISILLATLGMPEISTSKYFLQVTIVPRMGEEKGAVRFRTDHTKFELQSIRYLQPAQK
jgi:hypothetical protein